MAVVVVVVVVVAVFVVVEAVFIILLEILKCFFIRFCCCCDCTRFEMFLNPPFPSFLSCISVGIGVRYHGKRRA